MSQMPMTHFVVDEAAKALGALALTAPLHDARTAPAHPVARVRMNVVSSGDDDAFEDDCETSGRPPSRRDSQRRREALLKGKEGTRRRQRWENDRLIGNPHVQPPLPSDWEVQPTHPRHAVPYFLAPLWDASVATRRDAEQRRVDAKYRVRVAAQGPKGHVPKDLRQTMKRAKGARTLLQELEEEVRRFVADWERKQEDRRDKGLHDADSDEDEIVFVGRNGAMHDLPPSPKANRAPTLEDLKREMLVYGGLEADRQARFGRWLVHSIATYYGLPAWSVTSGNPARREAYVGIQSIANGQLVNGLPRPLWGRV